MANTQTVIIDFQADFSSVQDAVGILEKTGKVDAELAATFRKTNTEINKQGQALDKAAKQGQQSTQTYSKLSQTMQNFAKNGVGKLVVSASELAAGAVKVEDFFNKVKTGATSSAGASVTLRTELRLVKEQMQQAALAGGILSEEYKKLKVRAGQLDDTIKDVSNDIRNAGSDTRGIDNVVGSISALAGGFSAVQGAAALFGDESEDLQRALLRVNAAMALATGLQQVSNALTKQGSLTRIADAAATGLQSAAQTIYTAVTGRATAATVAFKVALAATGIGAVVLLVVALSQAFKKSNKDMEEANNLIESQTRLLEALNVSLGNNLNIDLARAAQQGKAESELIRIRGRSLQQQVSNLKESNQLLARQRDAATDVNAAIKLNNQIEENNTVIRQKNNEVTVTGINLEKQLADEKKKAGDDAVARNKELTDKAIAAAAKARQAIVDDAKAAAQIRLLNAKEGSEEELAARKQLLGAELDLELNNAELTRNQKLLLADKYFKDYEQLDKDFLQRNQDRAVQSEVDLLSRSLLNRNISNENRVLLEEAVIRKTAEIEIAAAVGNAEKIKLIAAKRDQDIADAKIAMIRKTADQELALSGAQGGVAKRALESVVANEKLKSDIRINAIRQIGAIEISAIDRVIKANRDANGIIGADTKALNIEYEQLLDQKAAAAEATEKKITDITLSEGKKRQDNNIAYIQATIAGLQSLGDILGSIQANDQQAADQAIQRKRREVDDLLEAGAITEKEARQRNKRIEAEERQAKQKAAQQQKNLAVFSALLAIPQAFIAGLTAPFPIGGPIYGAILAGIAATQAAVIAARPVPKFASGKKGSYSGLAEVGEVGAELIQRADGSMEVAANRQLVYLGSRDKVFTHSETKNIMPFVNKEAISANGKHFEFDYGKMAAAVKGKSISGTTVNIDKEFISESVADGLSRVNYYNRYYSSK